MSVRCRVPGEQDRTHCQQHGHEEVQDGARYYQKIVQPMKGDGQDIEGYDDHPGPPSNGGTGKSLSGQSGCAGMKCTGCKTPENGGHPEGPPAPLSQGRVLVKQVLGCREAQTRSGTQYYPIIQTADIPFHEPHPKWLGQFFGNRGNYDRTDKGGGGDLPGTEPRNEERHDHCYDDRENGSPKEHDEDAG